MHPGRWTQFVEHGKKFNNDLVMAFHGASDYANVRSIAESGFRVTPQKRDGSERKYGHGMYFGVNAFDSGTYASMAGMEEQGFAGHKQMFVCALWRGKMTDSCNPQTREIPTGYETCVDNLTRPSMYVVFDRAQVYPAYLVTYGSR